MFAILQTLCAAAFLAVAVNGASHDPLGDLDAYPAFARGLRRYRQHHHRRHLRGRHHKMALTHHYAAPKLNWNPDDDGSPAAPAREEKPMALPGRYPSVEKALDGMSGDLENLKEKQKAAKDARGQLEGTVSEVVHHMNDAMSIKHAIAQKEAQIRREKNKLKGLEVEAKHIEETHASLVNSLHRVLEPKLMFSRNRLERKEMMVKREEQAVKAWQEKKEQIHAHALQLLEAKKLAKQDLLKKEEEVEEAKKRVEVADKKFQEARQETGKEIQSYRYAETRLKAQLTHQKAAEEAALHAKESVKKLGNVLQFESEKVEESMAVNKNNIHRRMEQIEAEREKTEQEVVGLQQRYREWQERQRARAADVIKKAEDTSVASEAYADRQKQVLDTAEHKVVHDAEAKSDWAWESSANDGSDGGLEGTPSFSD